MDGSVIAGAAVNAGDFGQRQHAYAGIVLQSALVDFQTAGGMAQLGEIAIQLGSSPAERRIFFNQDDILAGFGRFERSGHAGNAAAHHEYGLVGRNDVRH